MYNPVPTKHTSIPTAAWTKVNAIDGQNRRFLMLVNESGEVFRVETVEVDGTVPTTSVQGFRLADGEVYQEADKTRTTGDVYVYQASGGPLITLSIKEGR